MYRQKRSQWAARWWCGALALLALPATAESGEDLRAALAREAGLSRSAATEIGLHVVDLGDGGEVFGEAADQRRILASNTKLFTVATALDRLGPGHFFETPVLVSGEIRDGTLEGSLAVVGGGDPSLSGRLYQGDSLAPLRAWTAALAGLGVERIAGELILVDGLFVGPLVHPDWPRDQLVQWYEAPVSALSFNDNCVLVKVLPGAKPGESGAVELVPDLVHFDLDARVRTTASGNASIRVRHQTGQRLEVGGSVRATRPWDSWVAVQDPVAYFGAALRAALDQSGVEATSEPRAVDSLPPGPWRVVAIHRSDLLGALEVVHKRSQNFYAESVVKLLGARLCGEGSWPAGLRVVSEFLEEAGIAPGGYELADGSGMSRNNRFTPRQVTTLLSFMLRHPYGEEFLRTLPYSGEEGLRWERRLAELPYRGNVFAKTGSLRGVSTLSGYAKGLSGRLYAFSFLFNGLKSRAEAERRQDTLVRTLVDFG